MWDPLLAPSCWHGVTTVMFGNCGVGFRPGEEAHRGALMDLMEGVEEIPNPVLPAGLTWDWESFPEFMDALDRRPRAIDIAAQARILPLRVYVMGDRAVRREPATPDDIAEMRRSPSRRCSPAPSASPPRGPIRTRPRTANWCRRAMPTTELLGIGSALGRPAPALSA
jgi:N-acyl-D-aspartate/D-glutamate deacylase